MQWSDYYWTRHTLQRIAEYRVRLSDVFAEFEIATEIEKNDHDIMKQFVRHGGMNGLKRKIYTTSKYHFVIVDKRVVTFVNKPYTK